MLFTFSLVKIFFQFDVSIVVQFLHTFFPILEVAGKTGITETEFSKKFLEVLLKEIKK